MTRGVDANLWSNKAVLTNSDFSAIKYYAMKVSVKVSTDMDVITVITAKIWLNFDVTFDGAKQFVEDLRASVLLFSRRLVVLGC